MKHLILFSGFLLSIITLSGCTEPKVAELEKQIQELDKEIALLERKIENISTGMRNQSKDISDGDTKDSKKQTFSGTVVIGKDLDAGIYDITISGKQDCELKIYQNKQAKEKGVYDEIVLTKKDSGALKKQDTLDAYILTEGTIIDISGNLEFKNHP